MNVLYHISRQSIGKKNLLRCSLKTTNVNTNMNEGKRRLRRAGPRGFDYVGAGSRVGWKSRSPHLVAVTSSVSSDRSHNYVCAYFSAALSSEQFPH